MKRDCMLQLCKWNGLWCNWVTVSVPLAVCLGLFTLSPVRSGFKPTRSTLAWFNFINFWHGLERFNVHTTIFMNRLGVVHTTIFYMGHVNKCSLDSAWDFQPWSLPGFILIWQEPLTWFSSGLKLFKCEMDHKKSWGSIQFQPCDFGQCEKPLSMIPYHHWHS